MAVTLSLNGDAGNETYLPCGALASQQMREVISDDGVFVREACTASQFGGSWFLIKYVGQGAPSGNVFWKGCSREQYKQRRPFILGDI